MSPAVSPSPATCKLPRGQYSVMMQMLGGSMHAPMKRVKWLNWMSRICRCKWTQDSQRG